MPASTAVIVQARLGSTRLPGKVMRPFGDSTLLGHILDRVRRSRTPFSLWVATSDASADDPVAEEAAAHGAAVFRGDEEDVLGRFAGCLAALDPWPDLVVRVCADRPFCCPVLLDELLERHDELGRPDYLSNTLTKTYPDGLDLELVRAECLLAAAAEAEDAYEREHVTPFLYRRPERFRLVAATCPFGDFSSFRATIDTERDYSVLRRVHGRLADLRADYDHRDVLDLATLDPGAFE